MAESLHSHARLRRRGDASMNNVGLRVDGKLNGLGGVGIYADVDLHRDYQRLSIHLFIWLPRLFPLTLLLW